MLAFSCFYLSLLILNYFWINQVSGIYKKNVFKNPEYLSGFQVYMYSTFNFKTVNINMCHDVNQIDVYCLLL